MMDRPLPSLPVTRTKSSPIGLVGRPSLCITSIEKVSAACSASRVWELVTSERDAKISALEPVMSPNSNPIRNDVPPVVDQPAHVVAMLEMTELVRQHAGDFVGIVGFRQQSVEQIDLAARQREGIGNRRRQHARLYRRIEAGGFADRGDELGEGQLSGRMVAGLAVEQRLDLAIGDVAEPPFEGFRHQRRQAVGGERNAEQHHGDDRNRGGERPADDGRDATAARRIVIDGGAARNKVGRERGVAELKPRQRASRQAAQAQHAGRTVGAADIGIGPGGQHHVITADFEPVGEVQRDRAAPVRRAVEIDRRAAACGRGILSAAIHGRSVMR